MASSGKMHIWLIEIPNCISENCVYLLLMTRSVNHSLNEFYDNLGGCNLSEYFGSPAIGSEASGDVKPQAGFRHDI